MLIKTYIADLLPTGAPPVKTHFCLLLIFSFTLLKYIFFKFSRLCLFKEIWVDVPLLFKIFIIVYVSFFFKKKKLNKIIGVSMDIKNVKSYLLNTKCTSLLHTD